MADEPREPKSEEARLDDPQHPETREIRLPEPQEPEIREIRLPEPQEPETREEVRSDARSRSSRRFNDALAELASNAATLAYVLASLIIDLVFVGIWAYLHMLFDEQIIDRLRLAGFNKISLVVLEIAFSSVTLFAVGVYIVKDLVRIYHRIWDDP